MGINFQNVSFKYIKKASKNTLNNVNIDIASSGEFIAILGHTGSGKSTLVQLMNSLIIPCSGKINIYGQEVTNNKRKNRKLKLKLIRSNVGLVFQFPEYQLFEDSVKKDILFGPKNFGMKPEEANKEALKVIKLLNIPEEILDKSPFAISGGQMRKVAIAGILASNPKTLILDEPTVGLDPKSKLELMELLTKIHKETNKTIIMVSHDMNVVCKFASRVIVLDDGEVVFDGKKDDLFQDLDKLLKYNLGLPEPAKLALKLKDKGLISFDKIPLTKEELLDIIVKQNKVGDINE